jgi:hypothetical protein
MRTFLRILLCLSVLSTLAWAVNDPANHKTVQVTRDFTLERINTFIEKRNPKLDPVVRNHIARCLLYSTKKNNIPIKLGVAWIDTENPKWDPLAKSKDGAVGMSQIMPNYYLEEMKLLGITRDSIYHIDKNLELGCYILKNNINEFKTINRALSGYNAGPDITRKKGIAPYTETKNYIKRINKISNNWERGKA